MCEYTEIYVMCFTAYTLYDSTCILQDSVQDGDVSRRTCSVNLLPEYVRSITDK